MHLAILEMHVFMIDEQGYWKLNYALVDLFVCHNCKSIFRQMIHDHDVVRKGCYVLLICMGDMLICMSSLQVSRRLLMESKIH